MRVVQNSPWHFGEVDMAKMVFAPPSRNDIPRILRGLQFVYIHLPLRISVFE